MKSRLISFFQQPLKTWLSIAYVAVVVCIALYWSKSTPQTDLGNIPLTEVRIVRVPVINSTQQEIRVVEIRPTCTCLSVLSTPLLVPPGNTLHATVLVRPEKVGALRGQLEIVYEGKAGKADLVAIKAKVLLPRKEFSDPFTLPPQDSMDAALLITKLHEKDRPLLLDVRHAHAYAKAHIPRSLNLPLESVEQLQFVRNRDLVLIDGGLAPEKTHKLLLGLKAKGFDRVKILAGGIPAWQEIGGTLAGEGSPEKEANLVAAEQVFDILQQKEAAVLFVGNRPELASRLWSEVKTLKLEGKDAGEVNEIIHAVQKLKQKSGKVVILSSVQGEFYRSVAAALPQDLKASVFFLDGGINAYIAYIGQIQHRWMMTNLGTEIQSLGVKAVASARSAMRRDCPTCP
jgi:rhodanese-related sulfurtransferase